MEENAAKPKSLKEIRNDKKPKSGGLRKFLPWLFNWRSTFYYGVFLFLLGALWAAYPLFTNSGTQLLNWDYTWQYIPFTYDYWDAWHTFFTTGKFPLYDPNVYLGTDMIGSGSYYGLFDPFMFICYLFPRSWIPQMYAQMTFAKLMFGGLMMRMYLKRMGIKEWTARIGGIIYAFSGFTTFFEGSPNFTSAMAFFPLILLGLENTIRDQKPTALIIGVTGLGLSCFFYMPVICLFGVFYALWRFFATVKTRNAYENVRVMVLGVLGFGIGILLSAFSLLPSFRETTLSGRSSSIGTAYWNSVKEALKSFDFRMFFTLIFEEVGDAPGRELMGVMSFFFPTGGWTNLPFARGGYDAWTASLFCYTPCVILFFCAIINSIRLRRFDHLIAVLLGVYAVFTNFSYFFFYAFSGNGYGRWFLILIPMITYYCCWSFDLRKEEPRFIPFAGAVIALVSTIASFYLCEALLHDKSFTDSIYNTNHTTYWQTTYFTASDKYGGVNSTWYFYYQLAIVVIEGTILCIGQRRKWLPYVLLGLVSVEAIVMGNVTYAYNGTWSLKNSFAGGEYNVETSLRMTNAINNNDNSFFRVQSDTYQGNNYFHNVFGTANVSSFHSLMNFDVETFALNNQMKYPGRSRTTYGEQEYYNPNWSGHYGNKRYVTDTLLGMRYYIVTNNYSGWWTEDGESLFLPPNVPFGSKEMTDYSPDRKLFRVYRRDESSLPQLGYAVNSDLLYRMNYSHDSKYKTGFFHYYNGSSSFTELQWNQYVELYGAIIDDDVTLPADFAVKDEVPASIYDDQLTANTGYRRLAINRGLIADYYVTEDGDGLLARTDRDYYYEGLGYFLDHYKYKEENLAARVLEMQKDVGKLVFRSSSSEFLCEDERGAYIEVRYFNNKDYGAPRIYVLGDRTNPDGSISENVCLSFDHHLMQNLARTEYYRSESCTVGVYAEGKVRSVVLCYGGSGKLNVYPSDFYCVVHSRSEIDDTENNMRANALLEVKTDVNCFTFHTRYEQPRIVVTQLGYDKGWQAKATLPDGSKQNCQMLRLNGGLVGFVAPAVVKDGVAQDVYYEFRYETPYSKLGTAAFIVGVVLFFGVLAFDFVMDVKKKGSSKEEPEPQE